MLTEIYSHYLRIHKGREDSGDEISIAMYVVAELLAHFQTDYQPYCKIKVSNL